MTAERQEAAGAQDLHWRPLSPAQLPIWRAEMLRRQTPRWTQVTVITLHGPVDPDRLERAINAVVARHPALRMRLQRRGRDGWQAFAPASPLSLARHDQPAPPGERAQAVRDFLDESARRQFPLYDAPLFRADLLILGAEESVLALSLHHIAADGVALALLVPQIAACYQHGEDAGAPDHAYERWLDRQRERDFGPGIEAALGFYGQALAGANLRRGPLHDRPADQAPYDPPDLPEATCTLGAAACDGLRSLARRNKATLFIVLLAAYGAALRSATGSPDLLFATFVSGRAGEPEPLVGSCINTVLVRLRLDGSDEAADLIGAATEAWRPVRQHQSTPMALLSDAARGSLPAAPFAINFLDMAEAPFDVPGLKAEVTHAQQGFPLNDLLLYALREQDGRLRLRLIVGSGTPQVSQAKLASMLGALAKTLRSWAGVPDAGDAPEALERGAGE